MIVVAIGGPDGEIVLPPSAKSIIRPDDVLIVSRKVSAVSDFLACEEA